MITIHSTGIARIRHNTTGKIFEIEAEELDWDIMGSEERQMGPENSYTAVVEHPELGSGLIDQSQKMTVAARATAEKKAFGQRS